MGIRFLCPNGHKLNVKAYLAGERGICPQCDAKFLVPRESGGQVEAITESGDGVQAASEPVQQPVAAATSPPPVAPPPPPAPSEPLVPEAPTEVWYVRAESGEQYGPASKEVMQSWVAEGRVTVDCWVWKSGWPDWKAGGQAITLLNVIPPSGNSSSESNSQTVNEPAASSEEIATQPAPDTLPEPTTPTTLYQTNKRLRQERARKITLLLGVVVAVLFAVLIAVLINNK